MNLISVVLPALTVAHARLGPGVGHVRASPTGLIAMVGGNSDPCGNVSVTPTDVPAAMPGIDEHEPARIVLVKG